LVAAAPITGPIPVAVSAVSAIPWRAVVVATRTSRTRKAFLRTPEKHRQHHHEVGICLVPGVRSLDRVRYAGIETPTWDVNTDPTRNQISDKRGR